ncbi:hypothetical protein ACFFWD_06960 [Bradyrhizobium erythrophlei]|uniref:hypothetical protein n=1 Tax=Bradyrhizobium erythrophlei TaxID=1437360 RepID=UPI0035ECB673
MTQRPPSDGTAFHPVWYITPSKSPAKLTCKVDLLATVLDGIIEPSSQVRDDGTSLWTAARDNRVIAPILGYASKIKYTRWLFLVISLALGLLLALPIIGGDFQGWRSVMAFGFVVVILQESYKAAVKSFELSLARLILFYIGGMALAIAGWVICDALIELARLTVFPEYGPDSGWFTLAQFVGIGIVFGVLSDLYWDRWRPYRRENHERIGRDNLPVKARVAQLFAKQARIHGLLGFDKCGRQVAADGDRYEGGFKESKRDGYGVYTWASGARYEGQWQKGERHGFGVEIIPDGTETAGHWQDGRLIGDGG